jgi:hypothetical protein
MEWIMKNLMCYFIERQRIVCLAMLDLDPYALKAGGDTLFGIAISPYIDASANFRSENRGIWKNEWKYRLHGIGCELVNIHTGEPLEWDAPDPDSFEFSWFWEHLGWRLKQDLSDPVVLLLSQSQFFSNDEIETEQTLLKEKIIIRHEGGKYRLGE